MSLLPRQSDSTVCPLSNTNVFVVATSEIHSTESLLMDDKLVAVQRLGTQQEERRSLPLFLRVYSDSRNKEHLHTVHHHGASPLSFGHAPNLRDPPRAVIGCLLKRDCRVSVALGGAWLQLLFRKKIATTRRGGCPEQPHRFV